MKHISGFSAVIITVCAAAFAPAALAVSGGDFLIETAAGFACGAAVGGASLAFFEEDMWSAPGYAILATAPAAISTGSFFAGEAVDGRSANRWRAWGFTTLASYGVAGAFGIVTFAVNADVEIIHLGPGEEEEINYAPAIIGALITPVCATAIYNVVKIPAAPEESRGPTLEPYVAAAADTNGTPVPLYGVTVSF